MLEGPVPSTHHFELIYFRKVTRSRQRGLDVTPINPITCACTAIRQVLTGLNSHSCKTPLMDFFFFLYLVWQITAFHFGKQRVGSENGSMGFVPPVLTPATAPCKLPRRGQLAPSHGAQTAGFSLLGKGEEAPKATENIKIKKEETGQERGQERRK